MSDEESTIPWYGPLDGEEAECENCGRILDWPGEMRICYPCRNDED